MPGLTGLPSDRVALTVTVPEVGRSVLEKVTSLRRVLTAVELTVDDVKVTVRVPPVLL